MFLILLQQLNVFCGSCKIHTTLENGNRWNVRWKVYVKDGLPRHVGIATGKSCTNNIRGSNSPLVNIQHSFRVSIEKRYDCNEVTHRGNPVETKIDCIAFVAHNDLNEPPSDFVCASALVSPIHIAGVKKLSENKIITVENTRKIVAL